MADLGIKKIVGGMRSSRNLYQSIPVSPPEDLLLLHQDEDEEEDADDQEEGISPRKQQNHHHDHYQKKKKKKEAWNESAPLPPNLSRKNMTVKMVDLYDFTVEGTVEDAQTLNEVKERVREQGRLWWSLEASKGVGWYLQPEISSLTPSAGVPVMNSQTLIHNTGKLIIPSSVSIVTVTNTLLLKKLIRKGIPPNLRSKVWLSVSGAAKKRSSSPDSYFTDLCSASHNISTASTRQIDHVSSLMMHLSPVL